MKKITGILLLSAALLCAGCGQREGNPGRDDPKPSATPDITKDVSATAGSREPGSRSQAGNEPSAPSATPDVTENVPTSAGSQEPYWAQGTQTDGKLFQGLNLDGVGEADDEAYVSVYQFGNETFPEQVLALRVHLGTGQVLAETYPMGGTYGFSTARLFPEGGDAIILSRSNRSTGTDTRITVLRILISTNEIPGDSFPYMWSPLDQDDASDGMTRDVFLGNGSVWGLGENGSTHIAQAPEAVDIEGSSLQGLKITINNPNIGPLSRLENIIYWKDGKWTDENGWSYKGKWEFMGDWVPVSDNDPAYDPVYEPFPTPEP